MAHNDTGTFIKLGRNELNLFNFIKKISETMNSFVSDFFFLFVIEIFERHTIFFKTKKFVKNSDCVFNTYECTHKTIVLFFFFGEKESAVG